MPHHTSFLSRKPNGGSIYDTVRLCPALLKSLQNTSGTSNVLRRVQKSEGGGICWEIQNMSAEIHVLCCVRVHFKR
jgi:hypothetical protein